jgi:hypothetical protein
VSSNARTTNPSAIMSRTDKRSIRAILAVAKSASDHRGG